MTLHATFRGGPADGSDRSYPHISSALPALWWTRDALPARSTAAPATVLPRRRTVERGDLLAGQNGATLIDPKVGAAYRLCCADPVREGVWIYVLIDNPLHARTGRHR